MERINSGVKGVGAGIERSYRPWNGIIAVLSALNREKGGVNGVGTEK